MRSGILNRLGKRSDSPELILGDETELEFPYCSVQCKNISVTLVIGQNQTWPSIRNILFALDDEINVELLRHLSDNLTGSLPD